MIKCSVCGTEHSSMPENKKCTICSAELKTEEQVVKDEKELEACEEVIKEEEIPPRTIRAKKEDQDKVLKDLKSAGIPIPDAIVDVNDGNDIHITLPKKEVKEKNTSQASVESAEGTISDKKGKDARKEKKAPEIEDIQHLNSLSDKPVFNQEMLESRIKDIGNQINLNITISVSKDSIKELFNYIKDLT